MFQTKVQNAFILIIQNENIFVFFANIEKNVFGQTLKKSRKQKKQNVSIIFMTIEISIESRNINKMSDAVS